MCKKKGFFAKNLNYCQLFFIANCLSHNDYNLYRHINICKSRSTKRILDAWIYRYGSAVIGHIMDKIPCNETCTFIIVIFAWWQRIELLLKDIQYISLELPLLFHSSLQTVILFKGDCSLHQLQQWFPQWCTWHLLRPEMILLQHNHQVHQV